MARRFSALSLRGGGGGGGGVLVLRGGPGTGKSALLDHLQAIAAARFAIMRFDAVESEAGLGFAALHQLLRPHLPRLPQLPDYRDDGVLVDEQLDPRARFVAHTRQTPWDDFHTVYFAAEALWHGLTAPFDLL
ncbi:hypothetical protein [Streptomyces mirabilis]|uniref:hypothetical protein n=1 Tax=Streptomyces mirabilis TaxID=68239 RepID=UPI00368C1FA6